MTQDEYFARMASRIAYRPRHDRRNRALIVSLKIIGAAVIGWGAVLLLVKG